jgi:PQQ-dependent dehydrogenase (methanol/ethanol family)
MSRYSKGFAVGVAALALVLTSIGTVRARPVTDVDLSALAGTEWLHGNGSWDGTRYSTLTQLTPSNAEKLQLKWTAALGGKNDAQATPLFHDGMIYVPHDNKTHAFSARNGDLLWSYEAELPEDWGGYNVDFITGKHRNLAISGDNIYFLSNDCAIHALNHTTGERVFRFKVDRPYPKDFKKSEDANGYACTVGPMAIPGKLIVPMNGTDFGGLQGYVHAHSLNDGSQMWAANMIPGPGEPGADTWPGDSRIYGGAGPWIVGSWDPELKMYYTGTANAYPWSPYTERDGRGAGNKRNEGAAAVVAVNTDTGKVPWRYTAVPGDPWDYDVPQTPMLITIDGRRTVVHPNKVCYIHHLDAKTGKFLKADPFCDKITWAKGYDQNGDPIWDYPIPADGGTAEELWPSLLGGVNMYPNAYNHKTGLVYLASREAAHKYTFEKVQVISNVRHFGVSLEIHPGGMEVERAMRVKDGKEMWRVETKKAGYAGGIATTAGGVTIWATQGGELTVADANNGKILWQFDANVLSKSGPITYMFEGKQYITWVLGGTGGFGSTNDDWKNTRLYGSLVVTAGL